MNEKSLTKPACLDSMNERVSHTVDLVFKKCSDSRGDECPYNLLVEHKSPEQFIYFKANLCIFNFVG